MFGSSQNKIIDVGMTFIHKNNLKGNNKHCYKQFLGKNI